MVKDFNRHLSKEDIPVANKLMKRCSKSWVIWEIQIKSTMWYHFTPTRKVVIKKWENNKCCWQGLLVEMQNGSATVAKILAVPQKVKNNIIMWLSNSNPRYITKRIENICSHKKSYMNIHSIIFSSQNSWGETIQMSIHWWINKMWYIYITDCFSAIGEDEVLIHATTWMDVKNMLKEATQKRVSYCMIPVGTSVETK